MALVRYSLAELNALNVTLMACLETPEYHLRGLTEILSKFLRLKLQETDDALHLKLELPGLEAKDLDIQVTQNAVHDTSASQTKTENNGTTEVNSTMWVPTCNSLSAKVQNTNVTADYKDGILTLPKTEQKRTKLSGNLEQPAA
ncbi:Hsp20/alpha crystallin family protein (plasmid) [Nostoc sp. C052]|uniref:Hsp20/alpha crystallin family protein n=1 Tax=Nostoc sp. C052 TaxID=2576902 RepID=UPI0015C3F499|nr:Hsp20 family protein [Nostoc sp. C052]QLE46612.1 Hsp20/alpha crystallin family protein [Nostoc sp. C052]